MYVLSGHHDQSLCLRSRGNLFIVKSTRSYPGSTDVKVVDKKEVNTVGAKGVLERRVKKWDQNYVTT